MTDRVDKILKLIELEQLKLDIEKTEKKLIEDLEKWII